MIHNVGPASAFPADASRSASTEPSMDLQDLYETARPALIAFGLKVLGAIALYKIGRAHV